VGWCGGSSRCFAGAAATTEDPLHQGRPKPHPVGECTSRAVTWVGAAALADALREPRQKGGKDPLHPTRFRLLRFCITAGVRQFSSRDNSIGFWPSCVPMLFFQILKACPVLDRHGSFANNDRRWRRWKTLFTADEADVVKWQLCFTADEAAPVQAI